MIFLGCDPDTQRTAWAGVSHYIDGRPAVQSVSLAKAGKGKAGKDAVLSVIEGMRKAFFDACCASLLSNDVVLAVESQEIAYSAKQGASPRDVALLGPISGAALGCGAMREAKAIYFPSPQEWKGSLSKSVHHARICDSLGWTYELAGGKEPYAVPRFASGQAPHGADDLNKSDWKHVMDAIGLAIWGMKQWHQEQTKQKYLDEARRQ